MRTRLCGIWFGRAKKGKIDHLKARHRLSKFLLRHDVRPPAGVRVWSAAHRKWLDGLRLEGATGGVFREYLHAIDEIAGRIARLEAEIHHAATQSVHAPVIQALQALRGVQEVTVATLVAEVGEFSRFWHPSQLMAYAGLVPQESAEKLRFLSLDRRRASEIWGIVAVRMPGGWGKQPEVRIGRSV